MSTASSAQLALPSWRHGVSVPRSCASVFSSTNHPTIHHQSPALLRTRAMRITSLHKTSRQTAISRRSTKRKANTGSQERQLCLRNKNRELPTSRSAANGVSMFVKVDHWIRKLLLCQSNEGHEFTASVSAASTSSTKATLKECL